MNLKDMENLYLTRQSCRSFSTRPVDRTLLEEVCKAALLAPSACNLQPWKLVVATGKTKEALTPCLQRLGMNRHATAAPVLIAIVAQQDANPVAKKAGEFIPFDLGGLTSHLILAAESAGLATCILGWRTEEKMCEILNLPQGTLIPAVVSLGYAEEGTPIREKKRKKTEETLLFLD